MKRKEFEEAVFESNLNSTAKAVCMAFAYHLQYSLSGEDGVFPSQAVIAKNWGLNKNTVSKYVNALKEAGWLVPIGHKGTADRVTVYRLDKGSESNPVIGTRRAGNSMSYPLGHVEINEDDSMSYPVGDTCPSGQDVHVLPSRTPCPSGQDLTTSNNQYNNKSNNKGAQAPVESNELNEPVLLQSSLIDYINPESFLIPSIEEVEEPVVKTMGFAKPGGGLNIRFAKAHARALEKINKDKATMYLPSDKKESLAHARATQIMNREEVSA